MSDSVWYAPIGVILLYVALDRRRQQFLCYSVHVSPGEWVDYLGPVKLSDIDCACGIYD